MKNANLIAEMLNMSDEELLQWEETAKKIRRVRKIITGLERNIRKEFIQEWFHRKNRALGGRTAMEVLQTGGFDQLDSMVYFFDSGVPS